MISSPFGALAFLNPWILAGLAFLPVLWFLLRVTPPAPRVISFPAARFLVGLESENQTPRKTPWWILILRLIVAALIIAALARPVLNPANILPDPGPVRLVIDNGWEAAQTWEIQQDHARNFLEHAARERREVYVLTTAPEPGKAEPIQHGPVSAAEAQSILRGIKPYPWPANHAAAATLVEKLRRRDSLHSLWLSTGVGKNDSTRLARALQSQGGLSFFEPPESRLPILLKPADGIEAGLSARVQRMENPAIPLPLTLYAMSKDGRVLDTAATTAAAGEEETDIIIKDMPRDLRSDVAYLRLAGRSGAGVNILTDGQFHRRTVGIVAPPDETASAPLTEQAYYIRRALEPYADVISGTISTTLAQLPSVMILPDIGAMSPEDLNSLEKWVRDGGLLLRFAGPAMAEGTQFLTPVAIRHSERALDGSLTWESPVKLAPFPENSPYFDLTSSGEDIIIQRQLLAEPEPELARKSWAVLADGTPLITADALDRGLIVLIHTTATPEWSNLSLSGLFVQILRRTVDMAGNAAVASGGGMGNSVLQPVLVMDGFGQMKAPDPSVQPIAAAGFDKTRPDSTHPPGIYGAAGYQRALNLGTHVESLETFPPLPLSISRQTYGGIDEHDLMPWVMGAALALFLLDWIVMILMQMGLRLFSFFPIRARVVIFILFATIIPAQTTNAADSLSVAEASEIHLAYFRTGDGTVDETTRAGLEVLRQVLSQRTSVEPAGITGLNPESDELAFYPLIYWPVTDTQPALSGKAIGRIQDYLDHGGTILIDTRDQISTPKGGISTGGRNQDGLRRITAGLSIARLIPMPDDHVLTKSFYLTKSLSGRYDGGTIWVEEESASGRDGVSSVIIGSHDWAAAWAAGGGSAPRISGGQRQQEMAMRSGVNFMMYALTGNYKADQVHVPHILERLGQ